jgi:hypothetical protein
METKKLSNNPNGRPSKRGSTEMVSKRLPIKLMDSVRSKSKNVTQFIIEALEEKLKSLE